MKLLTATKGLYHHELEQLVEKDGSIGGTHVYINGSANDSTSGLTLATIVMNDRENGEEKERKYHLKPYYDEDVDDDNSWNEGEGFTSKELLQKVVKEEDVSAAIIQLGETEDGFGLLRRKICRALEGLASVLECEGYTFWEERHPCSWDLHKMQKLRLRNDLTRISEKKDKESTRRRHSLKLKRKEQRRKQREDQRRSAQKRKLEEINQRKEEKKQKLKHDREERLEKIRIAKEDGKKQRYEEKCMREEERNMRKYLILEERLRRKAERDQMLKSRAELEKLGATENPDCSHLSKKEFCSYLVQERKKRQQYFASWLHSAMAQNISYRITQEFQSTKFPEPNSVTAVTGAATNNPIASFIQPAIQNLGSTSTSHRAAIEDDLIFCWEFLAQYASTLKLACVPTLEEWTKILQVDDGSFFHNDERLNEGSHGHFLNSLHVQLLRIILDDYSSMFEAESTIEILQTRPLNIFTWPEIARICCMIEMDQLNEDNTYLRMLKGNRYAKEDIVLGPLRKKLNLRGRDLLTPSDASNDSKESEDMENGTSTECFRGIVMDEFPSKDMLELTKRDEFFIVKNCQSNDETIAGLTSGKFKVRPGDAVLFVNGISTQDFSSLEEFEAFVLGETCHFPIGIVFYRNDNLEIMRTKFSRQIRDEGAKSDPTEAPTIRDRCMYVLSILRAKESAEPFDQPVDPATYPDYATIIDNPMDFQTIADKFEDEDYDEETMIQVGF